MPINPKYIVAIDLEEYFVNKDTGLPLANGIITFYSDINRTVLQPVYTISGNPPDYNYVQLPNPMVLSAVGTTQDGLGNNVPIYYYPYDSSGNTSLYYITVYSSNDGGITPAVLQFVRQGWPNSLSSSTSSNQNTPNFVPNGQFLTHNDILATSTTQLGQITGPITQIASGGWQFERPSTSTAMDFVTFSRFNSPVNNPTGNPRYSVNISNTVPSPGDTYKDLTLTFQNVNTFSSSTNQNTLFFQAISNTGSSFNVSVILIKNFGTGGSATTETTLQTITITPVYTAFNINFSFGSNVGQTIGPNNDDYVKIAIRFPTGFTFNCSSTDYLLASGNLTVTSYPDTTQAQTLWQAVAGWMNVPAYDGSDMGLPLVRTQYGLMFQSSGRIGKIVASLNKVAEYGELICNGSVYSFSGISSDLIPYRRLGNYFLSISNVPQVPVFGTGSNFVTCYIPTTSSPPSSQFRISVNSAGSTTACTDGTIPTGFTFSVIHGGAPTANVTCYSSGNTIFFISNIIGVVSSVVNAGTSGFNVNSIYDQAEVFAFWSVTVNQPASSLAGKYFTFGSSTNFAVWFTVDGSGTPPSLPGYTLIGINLLSIYTTQDVSNLIKESVNGGLITGVTCLPASSLTTGCFFNFSALTNNYYVWYKIAGTGNNPNVPGSVGIEVDLTGAETAAQVASKTQLSINSVQYAVPDLRGYILRGWNNGSNIDPLAFYRFSSISGGAGDSTGLGGDLPNTLEWEYYIAHTHTVNDPTHEHLISVSSVVTSVPASPSGSIFSPGNAGSNINTASTTGPAVTGITLGNSGQDQIAMKNFCVNWVITY